MNTDVQTSAKHRGFTLLELTIVILLLVTLMSTAVVVNRKMDEWRLGREASETLRQVYTAQRMFLADNPTRLVSSITAANVLLFMPGSPTALPTVKALNGSTMTIKVDVSPPVIVNGSGVTYDPSGNNRDSLWDVGL
jgi:prepilin-type N-terminal cleavage/methylation domain-containing protein